MKKLPADDTLFAAPPASALVEATVEVMRAAVRGHWLAHHGSWAEFSLAGDMPSLSSADVAEVERRILASGYRFAWSARISLKERPDIYRAPAGDAVAGAGFSHPQAPNEPADASGLALRGVGDNVVKQAVDLTGTARYIRSNEQVLAFLTDGVPDGTIAIIDDSGGTLTAPVIERFAGVVCAGGTVRSHLGILTREYNIPCLMNAKVTGIRDGDRVVLEVSAPAKTTEDYQRGVERTARIWLDTRGGA